MTPEEIRAMRERLGLSRLDLASAMKVGVITVERWENGRNPPKGLHLAVLRSLDRVSRQEWSEPEIVDLRARINFGIGSVIYYGIIAMLGRQEGVPSR